MVYRPPKIKDMGLEKFLAMKKHKHNGQDYKDLVKMLEAGISNAAIAKMFKVDFRTARRWTQIYYEEKNQTKLV